MAFTYPPARRSDVVDDHHGRAVADPYRWLEDLDAEETKAFVEAQNAVTLPYLRSLPERETLIERLTELWDFPRTGVPTRRGGVTVWSHNDGLADQPVFLVRRGEGEAEVLLDPNTMSDDGAVAVTTTSLSPDGALLAYAVSEAGSDRQHLAIRRTDGGGDLDDRLDHLRFTSVAWFGDGFFYTRWPEVEPGSTAPVLDPSVHYHRVGDPKESDRLVFHNDDDPELGYAPWVTDDDRYLVLIEYLGTSDEHGILLLDLDRHGDPITDPERPGPVDPAAWVHLVPQGEARHDPVLHHEGRLVVHTDRGAPNGAVVSIDLAAPDPERWVTVVPEAEEPLEWAAAVGDDLIVARLVEASNRLERHGIDGEPRGSIDLPEAVAVTGLSGRWGEPEFHLGYTSFSRPGVVLTCRGADTEVFAAPDPAIDPDRVVVERRTATSTDGAEVGMFVIRLADTPLPGPVELYGYGGFSINLTPAYSPGLLAFLEAGGIVAMANLRGGTERGQAWHRQGMLNRKQQVFDDFAACARALIDEGYATADTLGIVGGSNGGLLTAATMIQHPELFGAVVSQVPVTDMLRYQHFTAGRFWTVEYGDAADPEAFEWLIDYSPLHNVGDASAYPPLLITTAESDDRVVPMHAHKFAAEVQYRAGGSSDQPLLERVETRAGHGAGKPTSKVIEELADIYAFLLHHLRPKG